jgi:hypothetical protein
MLQESRKFAMPGTAVEMATDMTSSIPGQA